MTRFLTLAGIIFAAMGMTVSWVSAQEQGCASRVIEETVKSAASRDLGPSADAILQSIATIGREPEVRVDIVDIRESGTSPRGPSCTATMKVWREDTQETFSAVMQFTIVDKAILTDSLKRQ